MGCKVRNRKMRLGNERVMWDVGQGMVGGTEETPHLGAPFEAMRMSL